MEQSYRMALEIILNLCKENYPTREDIQTICETALKREDEQNESV